MSAAIALLDEAKNVKLIYRGSTLEAVLLNVPEDHSYVEDPPPNVEGGGKFRYDEATKTFIENEG